MQKKSSVFMLVSLLVSISCSHNETNDNKHDFTKSTIEYPRYYYWNELVDTTRWIPFRYLPYCGMKLDSIKKILGEPDFVSGCKMTYGLDKYGGQGCDIAPMFENDSCAIVYEYIWQPTKNRIQTILFFEYTDTHTAIDTPLWGFKVDLDKVMLE